MVMKGQLHIMLLTGLLLFGGKARAQFSINDFQPLHSLKGMWKMKTQKGWLYEQWLVINDSTLQNKTYRVNGLDTIPQETVILGIRNGVITYTSTVADQNNKQAIPFILSNTENGKYVFENEAHDFPQFICYELKSKNKLLASISGKMKGDFRVINFNYEREY